MSDQSAPEAEGLRPIARALLSVSDKTGLVPFAHTLAEAGVALLSTGGSARMLREAGLEVTEVEPGDVFLSVRRTPAASR